MKATIKYLNFQRNGVAGEPFYHCLATITDDIKRDMIITFQAKNDDKEIIRRAFIDSCPTGHFLYP